jgi:acetyl esterase/lipase
MDSSVVFCTHDGVSLHMEIAYPREVNEALPALLYFPGNGWGHWGGIGLDRYQYYTAIRLAAAHGYVAAAVDYRSTRKGECLYPAQLLDVRSAVRWLRAHHDKYHVDPDRIGAVGFSSGGHLALLLGVLDGAAMPDEADNLEYSSKVQAVVSLAGATELSLMYKEATYAGISTAIAELMGGPPEQRAEAYREASPLYHVTGDAAPVLLIQGDQDIEVPPDQATLFAEKMQEAGASATLVLVKGMGHSNEYTHNAIFPFLDSILKFQK